MPQVYERLKGIGDWIKVNGQAIYNSRPLLPYQSYNLCYTQSKDGKIRYHFYLVKENDTLPSSVELPSAFIGKTTEINLLGYSRKLAVQTKQGKKVVIVPKSSRQEMVSMPALVFSVTSSE